jgi:hypothetical protein
LSIKATHDCNWSLRVSQINQFTQHNAAMVEEPTAATHSLRNEDAEIVQLVGRFNPGMTEDFTAPQHWLKSCSSTATVETH